MKFFADTAEIDDIKEMAATGLLDGVTTNPSLIAKSGRDFMEVTKEICGLTDGPVSAEVVALDHATMMKEAEVLRKIADNVCIKVPLTIDGFLFAMGGFFAGFGLLRGLGLLMRRRKRPLTEVTP